MSLLSYSDRWAMISLQVKCDVLDRERASLGQGEAAALEAERSPLLSINNFEPDHTNNPAHQNTNQSQRSK